MLICPMSLFNESELWRFGEDFFCFMNLDMVLSSKLLNDLVEPDKFGDLHDSPAFSRIWEMRGSDRLRAPTPNWLECHLCESIARARGLCNGVSGSWHKGAMSA